MSPSIHKRRTTRNATTLGTVVLSEEVSIYFTNEKEWKLASSIYWERYFSRRSAGYFTDKYGLKITEYRNLMNKYKDYLNHPYENNKAPVSYLIN